MPLGYFTDSTPLTPLRNPFNVLVDGINDVESTASSDLSNFAATREIQTFRWADASERASQSGMFAGDMGYQVDTSVQYQYSGSAWKIVVPYAQAAGEATTTTTAGSGSSAPFHWSGIESVSFPAGRFSVAPLVVASPANNSTASILPGVQVHDITTSGFTYRVFRINAAPAVGTAIHWEAVQMLAASAAG